MLSYQETPIQHIKSRFLDESGIGLLIKREDLNHPWAGGNKWWKLKYNLEEAMRLKNDTVLTFGGAYSNHIFSTAAACREFGLKSIGIIRGEEILPLNPILAFAQASGMLLHFVSREVYKKKSAPEFTERLIEKFGSFYLLPEGGTNNLAVKGCAEFGVKLMAEKFDYLCLPVGTGGTLGGLAVGFKGRKKLIGFSALKGGEFLHENVRKLILEFSSAEFPNWRIEEQYHFGGYAKTTSQLLEFIRSFHTEHGVPLDKVYTAKMMFGILDLVKQNKIDRGSTVLALHTGGIH